MWACMGPGLWVPANLISESEHIPADIWVKEETVIKVANYSSGGSTNRSARKVLEEAITPCHMGGEEQQGQCGGISL